MATKTLFSGLVFDEFNNPVETEIVGNESFYIVNDAGFRRYISSEEVDRQILKCFTSQIEGNEDLITKQAAQMMGKDDIFSIAILKNQLKNIDQEIDTVFQVGLPADALPLLGMLGMKININLHGELVNFQYPQQRDSSDE